MPLAFQVANLDIKSPKVGENGYQGFNPRKETLRKGWKISEGARALSEDMIAEHDVAVKIPAIVAWSPFGKKHNGTEMMSKVKWGCGVPKGCLSGLERFKGPDPAEYCPRGYAIVNVDSRGAGDSEGSIVIMGRQEGEDDHDVIEKLAKMRIVQWFIAATQSPSLKAIAPWEACGDLYRKQFVRGGVWNNGLFDFITNHVIRGKNGLEDFREMYRRSKTMNPYWENKRAEIEKITIPTYIVASYSSFVHTMGSIRGWMQIKSKDKWLRWDPYQEWYNLWAVQESADELALFFDRYLKDEKNDWEKTPHVRMSSLKYGNKEAIYPIVEEDFPIPRTEYGTLYLGAESDLQTTAPTESNIVSYNSESGTRLVSHAHFNLRFDKATRVMGLPKAVLYISSPEFNDMIVYILIRKLEAQGKPMIDISIPWLAAPYEKKITPGEIVKLEIGIWAMGIDFEAGEWLSVQASSEYPLVKEFGTQEQEEERNKGIHEVHIGGEYASHIILPCL
ncbi:Alpha/Beta hydrolase protein [Phaeosphaeriaceae sp. PMI808]|nr:Alpha/Beta hydrolase protein [Phaeosphaeriaceae sp. PMI808]